MDISLKGNSFSFQTLYTTNSLLTPEPVPSLCGVGLGDLQEDPGVESVFEHCACKASIGWGVVLFEAPPFQTVPTLEASTQAGKEAFLPMRAR